MRILVADDERISLTQMTRLIDPIPDFHIVGYATDGVKAVEKAAAMRPDIVLMDIKMPRRDGLSAAREIMTMRSAPTVVFVSARRKHTLEAFDMHAAGYLLKPVDSTRLRTALLYARSLRGAGVPMVNESFAGYVRCRSGMSVRIVEVAQVAYLRAQNKYTEMISPGQRMLTSRPLVYFERRFGDSLVRVRRDVLANRSHIRGIDRVAREQYVVRLKNIPEPILISRRNTSRVRRALAGLLPVTKRQTEE